jgi:hypothetical protein
MSFCSLCPAHSTNLHTSIFICTNLAKMQISSLRLSKLSMWLVEHKQTHISLLLSHFYPSFGQPPNRNRLSLSYGIFGKKRNSAKPLKTIEPTFVPPSSKHHLEHLWTPIHHLWQLLLTLFSSTPSYGRSWFPQLQAFLNLNSFILHHCKAKGTSVWA